MTTGRINQVTILNPRGQAAQTTPQRRRNVLLPKGMSTAKPYPAAGTLPPTGEEHPTTDSIAPTEFPKGWSAARAIGHIGRQTSLHTPLEWRELAVSHALLQAVTDRSLPPRI